MRVCPLRRKRLSLISLAVLFILAGSPPLTSRRAQADSTPQPLVFNQDWSNTGLINALNDWTQVPGIIGYRGDIPLTITGTDPQTILQDLSTVVNVNHNQTNPDTFNLGGVAEFELINPLVALNGSTTADAPNLVIHLDTTGRSTIIVQYNLQDLDNTTDNAISRVALQYRIGGSGNYTNVPDGFVADATDGPEMAGRVTPVAAVLPADANNQPLVQVRIITADATGNDEWIGIDDIRIETPTAARLGSFGAVEDGREVLLHWRTGYEADNLGFNLYREAAGRRARLNPAIIAGSALLAGPGTALTAGKSYAWRDRSAATKDDTTYWLEEIDLNGARVWHGPLRPRRAAVGATGPSPLLTAPSPSLAALGKSPGGMAIETRGPVALPGAITAESVLGRSTPRHPLETQWELAARPAVKLAVRRYGWHRVGQPALVAAGLDPGANPQLLQLYADGRQQPVLVTGGGDGRFDPGDALEFYGVGLDTPTTDTRVYWLVAGAQPGLRIPTAAGKGGPPSTANSFPMTVERRERLLYFSSLTNGDAENFFGPLVSAEPVTQTLRLTNLDALTPEAARLEVALQGVTDRPGLDHRVIIALNGAAVGEANFDGRAHSVTQIPLPHAVLQEGDNTITLTAAGGELDLSLLDYVRLVYWHTFVADGDALRFAATGGEGYRVAGFSAPDVRVMDITDPSAPIGVPVSVEVQGKGYAARLTAPGAGPRVLLAFAAGQEGQVAAAAPNLPSRWHARDQGADWVVIGHRSLLGGLAPLIRLRKEQEMAVSLIDVEDLYDEFGYGAHGPRAINEFLRHAAVAWKLPPRFVLLVGDASLDPRNYTGAGDLDFVPTRLLDTALMETAGDDWLADFDGDGLAEIYVGRLPARAAAEAGAMAAKITSYERARLSSGALLVADSRDDAAFDTANRRLRDLLPPDVPAQEVALSQTDPAAARAAILQTINGGPLLVNFTGHGSIDLWRGGLLTAEDAPGLTNAGRPSFFVLMACLNGYFQDTTLAGLAEALMQHPAGGALAVWASSGMTDLTGQAVMNQELYRHLFNENTLGGEPVTLGLATARAKAAVSNPDLRRTWILFGDPATRLR